jgi:hypothetical protein
MNVEFSYLLGMITARGTIIKRGGRIQILIEIPHKNLVIEEQDTRLSIKSSIIDIKGIIEPLIGTWIDVESERKSKTVLSFEKDHRDFIIREINEHFGNFESYKQFRIPADIFNESDEIKKEFLRGFADVTGHVRRSNKAYGRPYHHRVYIEIPENWYLVVDVANLLKDLDIPVHTIDWGHPNIRDPNLRDYKNGKKHAWFREHQIKIFAEEFEKVGFRILHKMELLKELADENKKEWDKYVNQKIKESRSQAKKIEWEKKLGRLQEEHHKYYWETREIEKPKPPHPMENDERIPQKIRGRHFNSWKEIAEALGYPNKK